MTNLLTNFSKDKSPKQIFKMTNLQKKKFKRINLLKSKFQKEKSPEQIFKGQISKNKSSKDKSRILNFKRKNLSTILQRKNLLNKSSNDKST